MNDWPIVDNLEVALGPLSELGTPNAVKGGHEHSQKSPQRVGDSGSDTNATHYGTLSLFGCFIASTPSSARRLTPYTKKNEK